MVRGGITCVVERQALLRSSFLKTGTERHNERDGSLQCNPSPWLYF